MQHVRRLPAAVRLRWAAFRHLGPRAGTAAVIRRLRTTARAPLRRVRLRVRPVRVSDAEVREALGGVDLVQALRGTAREALPTVARWEASLSDLTAEERTGLLERADRILRHEFDLLGSGPTDLGTPIDWHRDFKTGRRWPLVHRSKIVVSYPDSSDIKVPWELSRFQHLPLLAAAHRLTGDRRYLDEIGAQLESWLDANPVEMGVNWQCTMDVAIRAANWVATLVLCAEAAVHEPWSRRATAALLAHGRHIRGHLEYAASRGNHYLSDVVGLQAVAAVFCAGAEGRAWARWTAGELCVEMEHQVRPDGCDHEMSLPYHRLVTELFVCGMQAADVLTPGALGPDYRTRLDRMLDFAADTIRPDGLTPQMGDADDGRYLPLGDYGEGDQRDHAHLFVQAGVPARRPTGSVAYPEGGWWVARCGGLFALIRCGDVGIHGLGCHAHNDQLSFELALDGQPLVVDPGSYLYTADPRARNLFRSTGMHATVRVAGGEQNPLREDRLFALADQTSARCLHWETSQDRVSWAGEHQGFAPGVRHRRRVEVDGAGGVVTITDTIRAPAGASLEWSFPLAGQVGAASSVPDAIDVVLGGVALSLAGEGLLWSVEEGWLSASYGVREPTSIVRARGTAAGAETIRQIALTVAISS